MPKSWCCMLDVNSTVCIDKGIHELGEFCGAAKPVGEWTVRYALGRNKFVLMFYFSLF